MAEQQARMKRLEENYVKTHKIVCELDRLATEFLLSDDLTNSQRVERDLDDAVELRGKMAEIYLNSIIMIQSNRLQK